MVQLVGSQNRSKCVPFSHAKMKGHDSKQSQIPQNERLSAGFTSQIELDGNAGAIRESVAQAVNRWVNEREKHYRPGPTEGYSQPVLIYCLHLDGPKRQNGRYYSYQRTLMRKITEMP